jgi:HAD superfamily hydrolase (TIGR01509 family)
MIRAVLFDVDGTLVDSNDLHAAAWQEAFRHFGVELPFQAVRDQIGKGGDNLIPALLPKDLVERRRQEIEDFRSELFQHAYLPRVQPFPGVRPLFERLYADGIRIVLATSAKLAELHFHRGLIGCEDLIHAATSQDDVEHSKPCPDIFETALRRVAPVGREEAIIVGDSPWDIEAACKAGLRAIGLRCGGFPEEWLVDVGAAAILDDPEDLLAAYPGWLEASSREVGTGFRQERCDNKDLEPPD